MKKRVLYVASIWPQLAASAASNRVLQLLTAFREAGYDVVLSADGKETEELTRLQETGISCLRMAPNDARFDTFLLDYQPDVTIFDRYSSEEKFGWRVRHHCPSSLRILDTIDLHCLRLARERALRSGVNPETVDLQGILAYAPQEAGRELAAMYRSDLNLVVSDYEMSLLTGEFHFPEELLLLCRLSYPPLPPSLVFADRRDFSMIGNVLHPPNRDAIIILKKQIWPHIRALLPEARVNIWGSHMGAAISQWHDPSNGFWIRGHAESTEQALASSRVNLAPLRFGAGIKGKIADGWWHGTPAVATPIAAEGMQGAYPFGGLVVSDDQSFAMAAVTLYEKERLWEEARTSGSRILSHLYNRTVTTDHLLTRISRLTQDLQRTRMRNFTGFMLWQQGLRASEYFSRWLEIKSQNLHGLSRS